MATPKKLDPDFSEFVALLNRQKIDYLIVGGYAVGFHGHARYTKDLDIWIHATTENTTQLINVLEEFGFGELGLKSQDFLAAGQVVQLGREPVRIDLLTSVRGVEFADATQNAITINLEGVNYRVIGLEDLIAAKKAAGRPQDLADVDQLQ